MSKRVVGAILILLGTWLRQAVLDAISNRQRARNQSLYENFHTLVGPVHNVFAGASTAIRTVECARDAVGTFATMRLPTHLRSLRSGSTADRINALLSDLLPHVALRGRRLSMDDLVVIDVLESRGAYFPSMHTDVEWNMYPTDGFQVWYLLENDDDEHGNMFVFETDIASGGGAEAEHDSTTGVGIAVRTPDSSGCMRSSRPLTIKRTHYLRLRPGECVVFGQNLLHMSDFRTDAANRRAVNFRVLVRDADGRVPFRPFVGGVAPLSLLYGALNAKSFYGKCTQSVCPMHGIGL